MNGPAPRPIATLLVLVLVAGAGCDASRPAASALAGPASASPVGTSTSSAAPSVRSTHDPEFEALVRRSIVFRVKVGLRFDDAWVRSVAADPNAHYDFDVPLTADEEAALQAREFSAAEVGPVLSEYGEQHRDEFAGIYIDQASGGQIVIMFTDHLNEHAAAIARLVRPGAPIEVRAAPRTEDELMAVFDRLDTDAEALRALGVIVIGASLDIETGTVEAQLSTERLDAAELLFARYGRVVVPRVVDPTGAFLKARGTIAGRVIDERGRGVEAGLAATPLFADFPMDSMGIQTDPDGRFRLGDYQPGAWELTVEAPGFAPKTIAVDVPSDGVVTVEIVLESD